MRNMSNFTTNNTITYLSDHTRFMEPPESCQTFTDTLLYYLVLLMFYLDWTRYYNTKHLPTNSYQISWRYHTNFLTC